MYNWSQAFKNFRRYKTIKQFYEKKTGWNCYIWLAFKYLTKINIKVKAIRLKSEVSDKITQKLNITFKIIIVFVNWTGVSYSITKAQNKINKQIDLQIRRAKALNNIKASFSWYLRTCYRRNRHRNLYSK